MQINFTIKTHSLHNTCYDIIILYICIWYYIYVQFIIEYGWKSSHKNISFIQKYRTALSARVMYIKVWFWEMLFSAFFWFITKNTFHKFWISLSRVANSFPCLQLHSNKTIYKMNIVRMVAIRLDKVFVACLCVITATREASLWSNIITKRHIVTYLVDPCLPTRWPQDLWLGDIHRQ